MKPGRDDTSVVTSDQDFLFGIVVSWMTGHDLINLASIMDEQGFGDDAEIMDGEKEVQVQSFIQWSMVVEACSRYHSKSTLIVKHKLG